MVVASKTKGVPMAKNRVKQRQNRLLFSEVDGPMSIEKIESRFEKQLEEKRLLAEAFMLGRNKYGNADTIPKKAAI